MDEMTHQQTSWKNRQAEAVVLNTEGIVSKSVGVKLQAIKPNQIWQEKKNEILKKMEIVNRLRIQACLCFISENLSE
jgi:hypothetical protein